MASKCVGVEKGRQSDVFERVRRYKTDIQKNMGGRRPCEKDDRKRLLKDQEGTHEFAQEYAPCFAAAEVSPPRAKKARKHSLFCTHPHAA
jgi:hypothetical protein